MRSSTSPEAIEPHTLYQKGDQQSSVPGVAVFSVSTSSEKQFRCLLEFWISLQGAILFSFSGMHIHHPLSLYWRHTLFCFSSSTCSSSSSTSSSKILNQNWNQNRHKQANNALSPFLRRPCPSNVTGAPPRDRDGPRWESMDGRRFDEHERESSKGLTDISNQRMTRCYNQGITHASTRGSPDMSSTKTHVDPTHQHQHPTPTYCAIMRVVCTSKTSFRHPSTA